MAAKPIPDSELNNARHEERRLLDIGERRVTMQYLKAETGIIFGEHYDIKTEAKIQRFFYPKFPKSWAL